MAEEKTGEKKGEKAGYVKAKEIANLLDISLVRVGQLRKEGVLTAYKIAGGDRYNVVEAVKSYIRYIRENSTTRPVTEDKLQAETRLKKAKARRAELETAELEGKMHRAEDVEAVWNDATYGIRSSLIALPGRTSIDANKAETPAEAYEVIKKEIHRLLIELSSYEYNPEVFAERVREREKMELDWKKFKEGDMEALDEYFGGEK